MIPDGQDAAIKDVIRLDIGVLKSMAKFWPIANTALGQIRGVARGLLTSKKALSIHFWNSMNGDEILQNIIEDVSAANPLAVTGVPEYPLVANYPSY